MIHIEQNQRLKDDQKFRAAVPTGDYNETDLIECYSDEGSISRPTAMFQAQYVVFGGAVYHQSEELTENQVTALLAGTSASDVINNKKLIDGKIPAAKYVGRIIKMTGPVGALLERDDVAVEELVPVEIEREVPIVPVVNTTPRSTGKATTTIPITNTENRKKIRDAATVPIVEQQVPDLVLPVDDSTSSSTPRTPEIPNTPTDRDRATSTGRILETIDSFVSPDLESPTPAEEIVAFAKKKIAKRLRL